MAKIIVGTSNPGKVREIASILSPLGHEIIPMAMDIDETGETISDNAKIKALAYSKANPGVYVIVEDSGLVVPKLNNLPGPYSARFHTVIFDKNLVVRVVPKEDFTTDKSEHDRLNNERLLEMIKTLPEEMRAAYFEVSFVIAKDDEILTESIGHSYGYISDEMRGTNGFGYDPLFIGNDTFGKTYAELDTARKNLKSHRKKALKELGLWVATYINV